MILQLRYIVYFRAFILTIVISYGFDQRICICYISILLIFNSVSTKANYVFKMFDKIILIIIGSLCSVKKRVKTILGKSFLLRL